MKNASLAIVLSPHHETQVLWIKRNDLPIWVLPGGGIEAGESPEEAMKREVREECGLEVSVLRKAAHYSPINFWTRDTHLFVCRAKEMALSTSDEACEAGYFPITSAPNPHFPLHRDWLNEAFQFPDQVIHRPIREVTWKRIGVFFWKHPLILFRYLFLRFMRMLS
jgi:ADP-ribose pyrophosphatase YjhB (NUDIX family)